MINLLRRHGMFDRDEDLTLREFIESVPNLHGDITCSLSSNKVLNNCGSRFGSTKGILILLVAPMFMVEPLTKVFQPLGHSPTPADPLWA